MQELEGSWQPLSFTVDRVCLLSRAGFLDPFSIRHVAPLGGLGPARRVDAAYVASLGPGPSPEESEEVCKSSLEVSK